MMGGSLILALLVLGVVVWAIIKFVPDWQDRVDLNRHEDSAEETLSGASPEVRSMQRRTRNGAVFCLGKKPPLLTQADTGSSIRLQSGRVSSLVSRY